MAASARVSAAPTPGRLEDGSTASVHRLDPFSGSENNRLWSTPVTVPTTVPSSAPALPTAPAPSAAAGPPLTLEWLVARDIDAYTARRRAAATMEAQASTRPSPASLRKNGTRAVGHA